MEHRRKPTSHFKNFLNWKEEYGENSREETKLIANLMDWITMNEGAFVEYPTDQNAKTSNKVYGIKNPRR